MEGKLSFKEAIQKEREVIESFAKVLKEVYGPSWNFEIDFLKGNVRENYTLRIKIYRK